MATEINTWRQKVCDGLWGVMDEQFQRQAWYPGGKQMSSPDEVYNTLFSDYGFEEFMQLPDAGLSSEQSAAGHQLISMMRRFSDKMGRHMRPDDVIDHADWREIRHAAKRFADMLGCSHLLHMHEAPTA